MSPRDRRVRVAAVAALLGLGAAPVARAGEPATLSFDEAVREAVAKNPQAQKAVEQIRRAEALVREARATSLPYLDSGGTYTRLDKDRVLPSTMTVISPANQLFARVTLTVPLVAPQQWVKWSHAADQVDVAKVASADVARSLAIATGHAYLTIIAAHRVIEQSQRAQATAKAHLEFARGRSQAGIGTKIDEVRAAQELALANLQLENALSALARAEEALGVLVGRDGPVDATAEPSLASVGADPMAALATRTDVAAARERWDAARRVQRDGWTDFLPGVTGSFQPFYQEPPTLVNPQTGWQAQLVLTLPLYDGGLRYGAQRERTSLTEQARLDWETAVRQARSDVRASLETVKHADAALAAAQDNSRLAEEALDLADTAYRAGATTNLELIDAQRAARDAATQVAVAEDAARQARLDLLAAAGRFP